MIALLSFAVGATFLVIGGAGNLRSMFDSGSISLPATTSLVAAALFFAVGTILI